MGNVISDSPFSYLTLTPVSVAEYADRKGIYLI
jgi:hypothetical protein